MLVDFEVKGGLLCCDGRDIVENQSGARGRASRCANAVSQDERLGRTIGLA